MPHSPQEVQEAVFDFHQYLSDRVAPLMVADSIGLLLEYKPEFMAAQIHSWVAAQPASAPAADYLYHAAKKVSLMGEFDLVPKEALAGYLRGLGDALLPLCPEADRELLRQNLERLGQAAPAAATGAAGVLHRLSETHKPAEREAEPQQLSREVRRLSLLLEHLRPLATAPAEQRTALASQFMATAAVQAASAKELDEQLAPLRQLGIETDTDKLFRTLARSLAGWILPRVEGQETSPVSAERLEAMGRIVALAEDPAEGAKRFRELVHAAIEQFNEGQLGRAVTMFALAERLVSEQKVKAVFVDALRTQGHEYLDPARLRKYGERVDVRDQLRPILAFFNALTPQGLLAALNGEPRRERRHELLALLEVHGASARAAAWELLHASVADGAQVDPFFQMNLVYLLRIVPRPPEASVEDEVNVVMRTAGRTSPPPLVKQIIAYLAQSRHEKAERALITYLRVFESMLLQPETAAYPPADVEALLDRSCAALARYGTGRAWRVLIDHGLKSEARLGSPFLRLAEAGRQDLSSSKDLVERVIAAIRAELPRGGVLGFAAKTNEDKLVGLIQALSGTPLPEVGQLMQEITAKHPGKKFAEAAAKALSALASVGKPAPPSVSLSGDVELFGVPSLLQTVSSSKLSGVLTLMNSEGKPQASVVVEAGQFRGAQAAQVLGPDALYQILERPFPGTFAFVNRPDVGSLPHLGPPQDVLGLLLEGVRRHDELKVAVALVPDAATLKATGKPRSHPPDEAADFAAAVWAHAVAGKRPAECEAAIEADAYRVRRLLAHWVEEGSLLAA